MVNLEWSNRDVTQVHEIVDNRTMLRGVDYLVRVHVIIVINGKKLWVTWLRILHNRAGGFNHYVPLEPGFQNLPISSCLFYI